jgi:guanylate kinase
MERCAGARTGASAGVPVVLEIEVQGAARCARRREAVQVFIAPPSLATLRERLLGRGTDEREVQRRLGAAEDRSRGS